MKRLFFISCLMFMVINVMAYQPMLIEGRIWTFSVSGDTGVDSIDNRWYFYYYKIDGDSVINGEVYKKVYKSYYNKTDWILDCLMIEDAEEGKVWKYEYSYKTKQYYKDLIFDFSLNVGDKFKMGSTICENIKYVKDRNGNVLKRMDLGMYCWIEGYGYEYNILIGASYYLSLVEDEEGILIDCKKDLESYNPMVVDGYRWNIVYSGGDDGGDIMTYHTYAEKIEGDSILNGIIYKKLWEAYDANWENKRFLALIREDIIEQKVFAYNDGAEVLLYDLGVDVGDTIRVFNWLRHLKYVNSFNIKEKEENLSCLVVEKIEFIEDDKYGKLKKITYYVADVDYPLKTIIYERYGSTTGWAITNHAVIDGGGPGKMICAFDEMGEVVYKRKYTIRGYGEVKDCYINAEVGTNVNLPKKKESVYYNSQDRTLRVDFERDEKIEIYNAMGKRVMRKKINEGCKSINCNLNAGVYIVTVKNSNTHTKIVVK